MIPIDKTGFETIKKKPGGFKPTWIIIHHSWSVDGETRNWDAIREYHMSYRRNGEIITLEQYNLYLEKQELVGLERPWHDIGYHYGIENVNGKLVVLPGRLVGEVGAHAQGFNEKSIGICLIGNYDIDEPDDSRLFITRSLCRQLQFEFKIPRDQVLGHRETFGKPGAPPLPAPKTCPGAQFDMEKFRLELRD